jgi:2-polyprenyl-3-methyl-5-hydroxy-6-metoxy-1,4-benzoquinol methylase
MPRHEQADKVETVDAAEFAKFDLVAAYNGAKDRYPSFTEGDEGRQKALDWAVEELAQVAATTTLAPADVFCIDIGCAHGQPVVQTLAERDFQVLGVDVSDGMLEQARSNLAALPNASFELADVRVWNPPENRQVDGVLTFYALGHLPIADYKATVMRMISWLKPQSGVLVLGTVAEMHGWVTTASATFPHTSLTLEENMTLVESRGCRVVKGWEEKWVSKNLGTGDSRTHQFVCARKS